MARMFGDAETPANNGQLEQGSAKHQLPEKIHQGPANVLSGSSSGASSAHIPAKMARLFDDEEADANNMRPQKGPNQQQLPDKLHQGPANVAGGSSHSGVNGGKRVVMDPSEKLVAENKVLRLAVQVTCGINRKSLPCSFSSSIGSCIATTLLWTRMTRALPQ